jgi:hypothetical protein
MIMLNIHSDFRFLLHTRKRDVSSAGIAIGHGMDDRGSSPDSSLLHSAQTVSGWQSAYNEMGSGGCFHAG